MTLISQLSFVVGTGFIVWGCYLAWPPLACLIAGLLFILASGKLYKDAQTAEGADVRRDDREAA